MKGKKTVSVLLAVVLILAFLPMAVSASSAAVDKTVLVSAIESAETAAAVVVVGTDAADIDYGAQWVTEEVMIAFKDAVTAAKTVNDNAGATETEVSGAAEVLETAAAVFDAAKQTGTKPAAADKTLLITAIAEAEAAASDASVYISADGQDVPQEELWVTAVEKNALAAAVTAAKTVNDNAGAAETEVSDVVTALNSAIAAFDAAKESGVKPAAAPGDTLITAAPVTGIDTPVVHGTPDGTADETPQYTAMVAWELGYGDRFKPETAYTAQVLLTAKPGYTFLGGYNDDASVAGFTVNGIIPTQAQFTVSEYDGRTHLSFKVTFSPTEGSEPLKTVTPGPIDGVTSPVAGALPSRDISGGAGYTAEISDWFITDNSYSERIDETKPFEDGKVYSIRVKLTAEPGYAFWDVSKGRIAGGHAGGQQDPALVAEAEAIVDSFTVNGAKPGMIDITIRFEITPYEIWFYLPFPGTQEVPAAPPPVTPPTIPGNEGEVQIDYVYRTGSGQVTLNVPEDKVGELIAGAKAAGHVVDINLTGVPGTTEPVTKVNLPVGALGSISAESLLLSLRFPDGTASISAEALGSFTGEVIAAGGENLSVTLRGAPSDALNAAQRAAVKTGESVYQISVQNQAETGEIHSFSGSFSVTLPYGGRVPNAVWCLRDDGTKESVSYTVNTADKTVTINLPHLSLYGLSYETTPADTDTDTGNSAAVAVQISAANSNGIPFTGDVSDTYMVWILLMVLSAGSLAVLFLQKKKMKNNR